MRYGRGVNHSGSLSVAYPSPQPSPARGEGALLAVRPLLRVESRVKRQHAYRQCVSPIDGRRHSVSLARAMTVTETTTARSPIRWIANQPYLLLSITAACWAGNAVVGKLAAGHIAPVTLSFLRWFAAFLIILPFAWRYLAQDWPQIRDKLGIMIVLSITGIGAFNTMQYWALEHTQAINT